MAGLFLDFGYVQREELRFPAKKLKAFWFSPPKVQSSDGGAGVNGPLPRIFISELLVDELSPRAQVCNRAVFCRLKALSSTSYVSLIYCPDKSVKHKEGLISLYCSICAWSCHFTS